MRNGQDNTGGYHSRYSGFPSGGGRTARPFAGLGLTDETDPSALRESAINPAQDPLTTAQPVERPIWIDPPTNWENIDQVAYALLPAIGSTVVIISFTVPIGRNGVIRKVANNFVGGGWTEGTGDVIWRILVDGAPPPGANSYGNIPASLGSPASPTEVSGFRIFENQVVTLIALNNPAGPNGGVVVAGQRVGGRLVGHLYPRELENDSIWI